MAASMQVLRRATRGVHTSVAACQEAAAAGADSLKVRVSLPHAALVDASSVKRVTLPGREGVFGLQKDSPSMLAQLKPGTVSIDYEDGSSEKYFIPGGFSFAHGNNTVDITTPEGVSFDQVDAEKVREAYAAAQAERDAASPETKERAIGEAKVELYYELSKAIGAGL